MTASQLFERVCQLSPDRPLRTLWRTTGYRLRPPRPLPYAPLVDWRQREVLASQAARADQLASVLCEIRPGPLPTIVLGGFVPDATESVYLQRGMLLRHGSVFYFNYAPHGFSTKLLFAQLDDLVEELVHVHGTPPVVFGTSFGCGLLMEWMRQARRHDEPLPVRGVLFVSPVTCPGDIIGPGVGKPSTLLGRAVAPFLEERGDRAEDDGRRVDERHVERCRTLMLRMFESGAQNKRAIRGLLTRGELLHIRHRVMTILKEISMTGVVERVAALGRMEAPSGYFTRLLSPLCEAPTLVLFAEKESSVLAATAPSAVTFADGANALFPSAEIRVVVNRRGNPVQHASLLFHSFNFTPHISVFFRRLREHLRNERAGWWTWFARRQTGRVRGGRAA